MQRDDAIADHQPQLGTHEFLTSLHTDDATTTRIGLSIAVLVHVVFFVINWPSLASSTPEPVVKDPPIRVLVNYFPDEPPPIPEPQLLRPQTTSVPMPDETPHEPEIVRQVVLEQAEFDWENLADPDGRSLPAPPPPSPPSVVRVHVDVEPPRKIFSVDPEYTQAARHVGIEGAVVLKLIIGTDGRVESVDVLRPLPMGLTESAVAAARQWIFEPSMHNGRPTAVEYILTVRFSLAR